MFVIGGNIFALGWRSPASGCPASREEGVQVGWGSGNGGEKIKGIRRCTKASIRRSWCTKTTHRQFRGLSGV